jgi:hypothetical protein
MKFFRKDMDYSIFQGEFYCIFDKRSQKYIEDVEFHGQEKVRR